jgi:CHAT domain-containing protein
MRARPAVVLVLLTALLGCTRPPPEDYVGGDAHTGEAGGIALGKDSAGETCTQQAAGPAGADIFCGNWVQPSGSVQRGGPATAGQLLGLATSSGWRVGLDQRFVCADPVTTTILGGAPALALSCRRKIGGWPQAALVAAIDGRAYFGDAVLPALPVLQRAMGVVSGRLAATAAPVAPGSPAARLFAARLAAQSFGSNDISRYQALMTAGTRANLAEDFAGAEQAFRAAWQLQQKVLGRHDPNTVDALMHLALQVSDQGRFAEADGLFASADRLAPAASDRLAVARLLHYRALDALNQHRLDAALALLGRAEAAYARTLPASVLRAQARSGPQAANDALAVDPQQQTALIGVIETRRYQAIVLRDLKRPAESDAAIRAAAALAAGNGLHQPILTARLYRTAATIAGVQGDVGDALSGLSASASAFGVALPGTRPLAATYLLRGAELHRQGQDAAAVAACRAGVDLLRRLQAGAASALVAPCLDVYAAEADAKAGSANREAVLAEMFEAAQLAQTGVTSEQIAEAAARLAESAKDPKIGAAIRRRQDLGRRLSDLYSQRESLAHGGLDQTGMPATATPAEIDRHIAATQASLADADAALQAAAPNYGQLIQQVAPAQDVFAALAPNEAFAAIALGETGGWSFLLRDHRIAVARIPVGLVGMAALVRRLRATVEFDTATPPPFDLADAQTIYTDTLGRLETEMQGLHALVVAPTGPLLSVPFGVLLTGPARQDDLAAAPWLIRRFAISHVPAATNFVALRRIAGNSRASRPWFGFGDFRPVTLAQAQRSFPAASCAESAREFAGLPRLPFAGPELAATRALLHGTGNDELLGAAFTVPAVLHADLSGYRVLHFAAHALLPAELRCESEPAIVTSAPAGATDATNALLTASDIANLKLDADIVILSACNSGGPGGSTAGESLSGLARAFFYAGARALMVTHWSVSDQASAFLVADTIRRLSAGEPGGIAGALRGAQLGMIGAAGRSFPAAIAHPFYWAPFALIGEGRGQTVTAGQFPTTRIALGEGAAQKDLP